MKRTVPNRMLFAETRDQLLAGREVVVRVLGQSMLPFFRSGSRITLRPLREGDLRRGHVVLGETDNGHFVVHRILTVGDERVTLLGDGNTVGTETIPRERIYGIVDFSLTLRRRTSDPTPAGGQASVSGRRARAAARIFARPPGGTYIHRTSGRS